MKNIVIFNYYREFNYADNIFNPDRYLIGENLGYATIKFKELLNKKGIEIHTADYYNNAEDIDAIIYFDHLTGFEQGIKDIKLHMPNIKMYLVIMENEMIKPDDYDKEIHKLYDKIFTWNDDLIDYKKYFKFYIGNKIKDILPCSFDDKEKLACMIVGNKMQSHPNELYSERTKAIDYFETNHPEDFDLYGFGWNSEINKSYKGLVKVKTDVYNKYKFAFCYENAKDISGYVTEKIWDVLMSGTIPIYYGNDELPNDIYIDIRKFKSYNELYHYIKNMSKNEYEEIIENIKDYFKSKEIKKYTGEYFAKTIVDHIL